MADLIVHQGSTRLSLSFTPPAPLSLLLEQAGVLVRKPCGGRGRCGKCALRLSGAVSPANEAEKQAGKRLICQTTVLGDCEVWLSSAGGDQITADFSASVTLGRPMAQGVGAAVDIGTTTIAFQRYDLTTGTPLAAASMINPQISIAADVMGRMEKAMLGSGALLQKQVLSAILQLLQQTGGSVSQLVITGNTTMLYLLTGHDPEPLSHAPFHADTLFDCSVRLLDTPCYLPRCMNAFVGADLTCAVLASDMCRMKTALLCDIGTNGEIALWKDGRLYVTATAAGPAFEGANISCGCNSIPGAIDRVQAENGALQLHTVADAPAVGICGSGLIDLAAVLLQLSLMDETGALDEDEIVLAPGVTFLQKDVRSLQLAKAAIAAGMETLLAEAGASYEEIEALYLAGSFGSHLNIESAAAIGLIPAELRKKVRVVGNAALAGAGMLLLDEGKLEQMRSIADRSVLINLGGNPRFNERYIEQMLFPE